ncbi:MAG TPA: ABC transporter permease [Burkholderiaceae bacterium]|nr:ABC transporter permease [Burkholderiaceae bacterium]
MHRYLLRRTGQAALLVLLIACLNFGLLHLAPGDAVDVLAGETGAGDADYLAELRRNYGLDRPLWVQLSRYVWNVAQFDFGFAFHYHAPVVQVILERLPATLLLMITSLTVALVGGVVLGVIAARKAGSRWDALISVVSLIGYATPLFWLGLMLIVLFSVKLDLLPSSGFQTIGGPDEFPERQLDIARHLVLPACSLTLFYMATYIRLMRAQMLEVANLEFVRTARAKGVSENRIAFRHVLRNAVLPVLSLFGVQIGSVLGGAVVVEVVFGWPGLGQLAFDAIAQRDTNLLMGILFFCSILVVAVNLVVDLLYSRIDPRIELHG